MRATAETLDVLERRARHYNATVERVIDIHEDLRILRVVTDAPPEPIDAGQYLVLALGFWEPCAQHADQRLAEPDQRRVEVIKRPYSLSCSMLDERGGIVTLAHSAYLEFYVVQVHGDASRRPGLTPRLFALREGDRMHVAQRPHGHYTLSGIESTDNVLFAATGTGEAPHNAMLAELLARGHSGSITAITCVRHRRDLGYLSVHQRLEQLYSNHRYVTLTTREPDDLGRATSGLARKRYIQDLVESPDFEQTVGHALDPKNTHFFLCGNPSMVGLPLHPHAQPRAYPTPRGMVEVLERRGFCLDEHGHPGDIHFERYW
jgi:ferredoxin--NADP+ reductase